MLYVYSIYTLRSSPHTPLYKCSRGSLLPETQGHSLEEMDAIFGTVDANMRRAEIEAEERCYA